METTTRNKLRDLIKEFNAAEDNLYTEASTLIHNYIRHTAPTIVITDDMDVFYDNFLAPEGESHLLRIKEIYEDVNGIFMATLENGKEVEMGDLPAYALGRIAYLAI